MAEESQVIKTKSGSILTKSADCGFFTPLTVPRPGTCIGKADDAKFRTWEAPILLKPLKLKSLEFKNRLFLSPMVSCVFFTSPHMIGTSAEMVLLYPNCVCTGSVQLQTWHGYPYGLPPCPLWTVRDARCCMCYDRSYRYSAKWSSELRVS
jgi:hypothetical protein